MCSGLCEIKDTGDRELCSSDRPQNIGCSLLTVQREHKQTWKENTYTLCFTGHNMAPTLLLVLDLNHSCSDHLLFSGVVFAKLQCLRFNIWLVEMLCHSK